MTSLTDHEYAAVKLLMGRPDLLQLATNGLYGTPKPHRGLTKKQAELFGFIKEYMADHLCSPSFDEMKEAIGLRSKSGVHRLVTGLEDRGFIARLPNCSRSIILTPQNPQVAS